MVSLRCNICGALDVHPRPYQTIKNKLDEHLLMCQIATTDGFLVFYEDTDSLVPVHFTVGRERSPSGPLCEIYQRKYHDIHGEWELTWAIKIPYESPEMFDSINDLIYKLRNAFGIPV